MSPPEPAVERPSTPSTLERDVSISAMKCIDTHSPQKAFLPKSCCLQLSRRQHFCEGCSQAIPHSDERYVCEQCRLHICKECNILGAGEGGFLPTASVGLSENVIELVSEEEQMRSISSAVIRRRQSESVFPIISSNSLKKPGNQKPSGNKKVSPRVAAAELTFSLKLDGPAQQRWKTFADQGDLVAEDDAGTRLSRQLYDAAKMFAGGGVKFLELTVLSQHELNREQSSRDKQACLELYSPFAGVSAELKAALIEAARQTPQSARSMGALVGMAVGDALGAPFEFLGAVDTPGATGSSFNLTSFRGSGGRSKFKVDPGQWTDDTAMGLCLADSILAKGCYDGADTRIRYHNWWFRGYNNAFGNASRIGSVGLGGNVAKSLRSMRTGVRPSATYEESSRDAGNGTIMRLAAVPIFYALDPVAAARASAASSAATHPGPIAAAAAAFQGFLIASAIGRPLEAPSLARNWLDEMARDYEEQGVPGSEGCPELLRLLRGAEQVGGPEECWNWRSPKLCIQSSLRARGREYNGYPCTSDYFGSYCIDGLAVALWCIYNTAAFAEAIVRCTNFLGDADSTSAICGQIAGAFYGYDSIDQRWLDMLEAWDDRDIACRAALLCAWRAPAAP